MSAVLGLSDKGDYDWARLRGLQYPALAKLAFYRVLSQAILAVFVAQIYISKVGLLAIIVWFAAQAAVQWRGVKIDFSLADADRRRITQAEFQRQASTAVLSGLVWGLRIVAFPFFGSPGDLMALLVVVAILGSGSVFFYTAAPFGIVCFVGIIGSATMLHLGLAGEWCALVAVLLFTIVALLGTIEMGRTFLTARFAEAAVTEKEEVVSLLLREFEENEADWLWEIDTTRRLRSVSPRFTRFRGVGSDVTEQRKPSEKIAYLARYDTLTQLPNRLQLTEALGEGLRYAEQWRTRCALLMVDLDRFKSVNDSLGHMTGDKLLAQVSARLKSLMGENQMCGRLGGDEFAIVIRDLHKADEISELAKRVIDHLSEPYQVDQHTLYVGASVGSAMGPRDGKTVEELMRNADLALYRAKDAGGGEHCRFEPVLHASAEERRQLEVALRKVLGRDEMELHYQPVVGSRSEKVVSFEALVRWNSADHGFISPGKFIPLAEDTRLIEPIGKWVMRKACEEARNWPDHVKVNVNVSPEQLLEPGFHQEVVEALAASGLKPERLEVEVTESIFLRDASVARNALEQVMALGCSVALDDFGTGYSSLGYIRKLRFSTMKVDRTFVQGAAQGSAESLAIINAVVAMAKSLAMTTTAEGVETAEEAELIRNLGCDKIQGYYFGRPMPSYEAQRLFSSPHQLRA